MLALGRLGGRALTHASDLDLVYLYDAPDGARSDGAKALPATDYYNRLASRITAALSVPTAAGPLYEVDTRLRPQGAQGMLAVSLKGFDAYQRDEAWTWEHMALCRARPLTGSPELRAQVAERIAAILSLPRDARRDPRRRGEDARRHGAPQAARGGAGHQAGAGRAGRPGVRRPHAAADAPRRARPAARGRAGGAGRGGTDRRRARIPTSGC